MLSTTEEIRKKGANVKIGVPIFGYDHFTHFEEFRKHHGYYTINLGDNMQSIAVRSVLKRIGIRPEDIVSINRDGTRDYSGELVSLIMNGVFPPHCFPMSPKLHPIFIGFHATAAVISENRNYFRRYAPIGCRDTETRDHFQAHGIDAFVTGCLTMGLLPRVDTPSSTKLLVIYGSGAGELPASVIKHVPPSLLDTAEFVSHRMPVMEYPLSENQCLQIERYVEGLLKDYASRATLILTPLHHAATPCMAMGIPTIICRSSMDGRFSYVKELVPVYTPDLFSRINWYPAPFAMTILREKLEKMTASMIARAHHHC
jgi:hypothetical protein